MRELVDSSQLSHFLYDSPRAKNAKQIDQRIRIQKFQQVKVTCTMIVFRQFNETENKKKLFHYKKKH